MLDKKTLFNNRKFTYDEMLFHVYSAGFDDGYNSGPKWVKASERLPELKGFHNEVFIKCTDPNFTFTTKGYRNYDEENPAMYMDVAYLGLLTTHKEADYRTTIPIQYIEWLEEK